MSKVACIWCENGNASPKKGYWWMCDICLQQHFERVMDLKSFMEEQKINPDFEKWWKQQLEFLRKWEGTQKLIQSYQNTIKGGDK